MWKYINHKKNILGSQPLGIDRSCPICNSSKSKTILELENFQFYSDSDRLKHGNTWRDIEIYDTFF